MGNVAVIKLLRIGSGKTFVIYRHWMEDESEMEVREKDCKFLNMATTETNATRM